MTLTALAHRPPWVAILCEVLNRKLSIVLHIHLNESSSSSAEYDYDSATNQVNAPENLVISQPKSSLEIEAKGKRRSPMQHTGKKRKKCEDPRMTEMKDNIDALLLKTLARYDEDEKREDASNENDSDLLFLKSLIPILQKLPRKKNRLVPMDIQKIVMDCKFDDEDTL